MPKFYKELNDDLADWVNKQPLFFTASAPLVGDHINVSPKGIPSASFSVLSPTQVAYIDSTGSGCESISHLYENGRMTIMFLSFSPSPRILRLFCKGRVYEVNSREFNETLARMGEGKNMVAARAVIVLDIFKVQTSCGYGVPIVNDKGEFLDRDTIKNWGEKQAEKGNIRNYQVQWNTKSLDGCPGLKLARRNAGEVLLLGNTKAAVRRMAKNWDILLVGFILGMILFAVCQTFVDLGDIFKNAPLTGDW